MFQRHCCRDGSEVAANFAGFARNGFEEHRTPVHVDFEAARLPVGGADLDALELKPSAFVEAAEKAKAKIHVRLQASIEANQVLAAHIDPQLAGHGVKDASLDRLRGILRIGPESQMPAVIFLINVLEEKRVRKQREDAANPFLVVEVLLAEARFLGVGGEQMIEVRALSLLRVPIELPAVVQDDLFQECPQLRYLYVYADAD